jgi:predicted O-methyltransferase YrrM
MIPLIDEIYRDGTALDDKGNRVEVLQAGGVARQDGEDIYKTIRAGGARETLEIGFAYGISTLFILQALQDNGGATMKRLTPSKSFMEMWAWRTCGVPA